MKTKVFINCPYDDKYKPYLFVIIYFLYKIDMIPLLASDVIDCGETRIEKILKLIEESQVGFHDISRMKSEKENEIYRLNMSFELGMDFAYKYFRDKKKEIVVFDCEKYRYHQSLSDLSGMDIMVYHDDIQGLLTTLREWIISKYKITDIKSPNTLKAEYEDFQAWLIDKLEGNGFVVASRKRDKSSNSITIYKNYIKQITPKEFGNYCEDYFLKNKEKKIIINN